MYTVIGYAGHRYNSAAATAATSRALRHFLICCKC